MDPYCANIEITGRCNYNCAHCFDKGKRKPQDMEFYRFKVIFDKLRKGKIFYYNLIGGEPLLNRNWQEIVRYIRKKKVCYAFSTNGSLLDESNIQFLKENKVNHVGLSLDGPKDIHNRIRNNKQAFDHLVKCTRLLRKYNISFVFQMTLMRINQHYVVETCKIAKKFGASAIRINFYKNFNESNKFLGVLSGENLQKVITNIETLIKRVNKNLTHFKINFENSLGFYLKKKSTCGAGINKLQIDPDGNVAPCRYLPINIGNLYDNELSTILKHPIIKELRVFHKVIKKGCSNCADNKSCRGGCPAFIYNAYGNLSERDPRCWRN